MKRIRMNLAMLWAIVAFAAMSVTPTCLRNLDETKQEWEEFNGFQPHHSPLLGGSRIEPSPPSSPAAGTISGAEPPRPMRQSEPTKKKATPESLRSGKAGASREAPPESQTRGDVTRISGRAVVTTYHPNDADGGGWGTASGTRVREGVCAVKTDYFKRLRGSVIEIEGLRFTVEDSGPFYGKNERAVDVARFGAVRNWSGMRARTITVISTDNPAAWRAYLKRAGEAAKRKGYIK